MKAFVGGSRTVSALPGRVPPELERAVLERCFRSEAMRSAAVGVGGTALGDIVCGAPIPLVEKLALFERLAEHENLLRDVLDRAVDRKGPARGADFAAHLIDDGCERSFSRQAADISRALDNLSPGPGDVLALSERHFDEGQRSDCIDGFVLFASRDKAEEYIRNEWEYWPDGDITWWYGLQRWIRDDSGRMRIAWTYWLLYDGASGFEPSYFEERAPKRGNAPVRVATHRYSAEHANLNLRVPFSTGDLVEVDLRPFAPPLHALVIEPEHEDFTDCCRPQVLARRCDGRWDVAALKHLGASVKIDGMPCPISPLYRARALDESELSEREAPLLEARAALGNDPERGSALWSANFEDRRRYVGEDGRMDDAGLAALLEAIGNGR